MADDGVLWVGNDNVVEVRDLKSSASGAFQNSKTVEVTLYDADDAEVDVLSGSITWPLSMSYVSSSDGVYQATLPDTLDLTEGAFYTAIITADAGAGLYAKWTRSYQAKKRT